MHCWCPFIVPIAGLTIAPLDRVEGSLTAL